MPLHAFICSTCTKEFNRLTSQASAPCPTCGEVCSWAPPTTSLLETPSNFGRRLSRQTKQLKSKLSEKQGIRG